MNNEQAAESPSCENKVSRQRLLISSLVGFELLLVLACYSWHIWVRVSLAHWPSHSAVKLNMAFGLITALATAITGAMVIISKRNPQSRRPWLAFAFVLGLVLIFAQVKELNSKANDGFGKVSEQKQIHESADIYYLAEVANDLRTRLKQLESAPKNSRNEEMILLLEQIQSGLIRWTENKAGMASDKSTRRQAIATLAHQIRPTFGSASECDQSLVNEEHALTIELQEINSQISHNEEILREHQAKILELQPGESETATPEWEATKNQAKLTTQQITKDQQRLSQIRSRLDAINFFWKSEAGKAKLEQLELPFVLPGGRIWGLSFFVLTGLSLAQVIAGAFGIGWLLKHQAISESAKTMIDRHWLITGFTAAAAFVSFYLL